MFSGLADWWDGVELWLAQAWFPVQFVLVMVIVVPLCLVAALLLDRLVGLAARLLARARGDDRPERP
ncbi:MAG TPA: hypothetical protein VJX66_27580 [Amycolatopsis sp.]|nr:hypothetical protein [Amycolatopsis sp.]